MNFSDISFVSAFYNNLADDMRFVQQNAWAKNTLKSLNSEWNAFKTYCTLAGIFYLPIEDHDICFFAQWLVSSGRIKTKASLAQYVSAVRTVCGMLNVRKVPTPSQYGPLDLILKGVRRLAEHKIKKSLPVSPSILKRLLLTQISDNAPLLYHHTLTVYRSLCVLYYLTMLRSSNLIARSPSSVDPKMILCWKDITPLHNNVNDGILIRVHKSKNNQFGERVHEIPLAASDNSLVCPVKAVLALVDVYGKDECFGDKPVFRLPDANGRLTPVVRDKFNRWFKFRIQAMGLDDSLYTLHGFRHGGIQECLLAEGNIALCKLTSDHSSDAIQEYAFVPAERRLTISDKVNKSLAAAIALPQSRLQNESVESTPDERRSPPARRSIPGDSQAMGGHRYAR